MKLKIFQILMILGAMVAMTSCDEKWDPKTDKTGQLDLSTVGVDVNDTATSRAANVDISKFIITVSQGETKVEEWTYDAMPEIITLPVGQYTLKVRSHEVQKAEFDRPYYLGSVNFEIKQGEISSIGTVECKFSSIKVTIIFSDKLKAKMDDDCKVVVRANDAGELAFTRDNTKSGFFEAVASSSTLVASFTGTVDGNYRELTPVTYTDVVAGTHYTITYSLREGSGTIITDPTVQDPDNSGTMSQTTSGGITISTNIDEGNTQTINTQLEVGDEEDAPIDPGKRPGTEDEPSTPDPGTDPSQPGDPAQDTITFSSSTLSFTSENSVDVSEALVVLNSEHGFAHLYVDISSDNQAFLDSAGELLPMSFDLATVTGETATNLSSIGLPVGPYPANQTQIDFNITDLVPLLSAFPGHHQFLLKVVDNNGNEKSLTLKFVAA